MLLTFVLYQKKLQLSSNLLFILGLNFFISSDSLILRLGSFFWLLSLFICLWWDCDYEISVYETGRRVSFMHMCNDLTVLMM